MNSTDNATLAVDEPQHGDHLRSFDEHGQTWVECLYCGRQWSVQDDGPAELVTEGDGWCDEHAEES